MDDFNIRFNIKLLKINYDKTCCVLFSFSKIKSFKLNEVLKVSKKKKIRKTHGIILITTIIL